MINRIINKIKRDKKRREDPRSKYLEYIEALPLDEYAVLVEGSRGSNVDGNTYYCACEILNNSRYEKYRIYVVVADEAVRKAAVKKYGKLSERINFVLHNTSEYYQKVASCKYLINDATFAPFFVKRDGQVFLDTWHGTPLKAMGRKNLSELDVLGNVQHNLCMADYILAPNSLTEKVMTEDYMVDDICSARQLHSGYPRNIAFDDATKDEIKKALGLEGKTVYVYLPTWRGLSSGASEDANLELANNLKAIDELLTGDEVVLAKLHHLSRTAIDFGEFKHIVSFPDEMETYEVLNSADILITDYSSVMFDFAFSNRSIVLYTYDSEEYEKDRGFNLELGKLPFARAATAEKLVDVLRNSINSTDDNLAEARTSFVREYCLWDSKDAAREVVSQLIFGESGLNSGPTLSNGRPNVLIYGGSLEDRSTAEELDGYFAESFGGDKNYYIAFFALKDRSNAESLRMLIDKYDGLRYIEFRGRRNYLKDNYKRNRYEYDRLLGSMRFDEYIVLPTSDGRIEAILDAKGCQYRKVER